MVYKIQLHDYYRQIRYLNEVKISFNKLLLKYFTIRLRLQQLIETTALIPPVLPRRKTQIFEIIN